MVTHCQQGVETSLLPGSMLSSVVCLCNIPLKVIEMAQPFRGRPLDLQGSYAWLWPPPLQIQWSAPYVVVQAMRDTQSPLLKGKKQIYTSLSRMGTKHRLPAVPTSYCTSWHVTACDDSDSSCVSDGAAGPCRYSFKLLIFQIRQDLLKWSHAFYGSALITVAFPCISGCEIIAGFPYFTLFAAFPSSHESTGWPQAGNRPLLYCTGMAS